MASWLKAALVTRTISCATCTEPFRIIRRLLLKLAASNSELYNKNAIVRFSLRQRDKGQVALSFSLWRSSFLRWRLNKRKFFSVSNKKIFFIFWVYLREQAFLKDVLSPLNRWLPYSDTCVPDSREIQTIIGMFLFLLLFPFFFLSPSPLGKNKYSFYIFTVFYFILFYCCSLFWFIGSIS